MTSVTDMQRDVEDFVDRSNVLPFVRRVHVCPNTRTKTLEYEDGTMTEYREMKKDAGQ